MKNYSRACMGSIHPYHIKAIKKPSKIKSALVQRVSAKSLERLCTVRSTISVKSEVGRSCRATCQMERAPWAERIAWPRPRPTKWVRTLVIWLSQKKVKINQLHSLKRISMSNQWSADCTSSKKRYRGDRVSSSGLRRNFCERSDSSISITSARIATSTAWGETTLSANYSMNEINLSLRAKNSISRSWPLIIPSQSKITITDTKMTAVLDTLRIKCLTSRMCNNHRIKNRSIWSSRVLSSSSRQNWAARSNKQRMIIIITSPSPPRRKPPIESLNLKARKKRMMRVRRRRWPLPRLNLWR